MGVKKVIKQVIKSIVPDSIKRQVVKILTRLIRQISHDQFAWIYQRIALLESLEYKFKILEANFEKTQQKLLRLESLEYKFKMLEKSTHPRVVSSNNINESVLLDGEYDELEKNICSGRLEVEDSYFDALAESFPDKASVLDLGCGQGRFIQALNKKGFVAKGIDANNTYENIPGVTIGKLPEVLGDRQSNSIDIVVSFHVIEHLDLIKYRETINEAFRVLKEGGKVFLETPNTQSLITMSQYYYKDPTHLMPRHPEVYANILEFCGFKNVIVKNLPELDAHTFEGISQIDNVEKELLHQVNNKFLDIENLLFANSGNVLIVGEK